MVTIDLEPLKKLFHRVSTDKDLYKTQEGKSLQKETIETINKFVTTRNKLLKISPVPENINSESNIENSSKEINELIKLLLYINNDITEKVEKSILTSKTLKKTS